MLGHSHSISGLAAGALTLPIAPVDGLVEQLAWTAAWGGFALLPDLDQGSIHWKRGTPRLTGSTVAMMWGPVTTGAASLVGKLARGHRQGTHDLLLAPLVCGGLAALAAHNRWTALVVLALGLGLALRACNVIIPGSVETTVVGNLLLSWGGAWWLTSHGLGTVDWLPWAVAGGILTHIAGDWLTRGGIPVPFTWLAKHRRRVALDLFRTGAQVETKVLVPVFGGIAVIALVVNSGLVRLGA